MRYLTFIVLTLLIISCDETDVPKEYNSAITFYEYKEYEKAIAAFSTIMGQTDTCMTCLLYRGDAYRELGQPEKARGDFDQLVSAENEQHKLLGYANRGGTYYDEGKFELALGDYKKALGLEPKNAILLNMVSHMCFATNDKENGCYYYWESVKLKTTEFNPEIPAYCDSLAAAQ